MSVFKSVTVGLFITGLISVGIGASAAPVPPIAVPAVMGLHEPLVVTRSTNAAEDQALSAALDAFNNRSDPSDLSSLTGFLKQYPHSGWASALWTNIGLSYLHDGYFSRAIEAWQNAWGEGADATSAEARALVDRAIGELAGLDANLGKSDDLAALFDRLGQRKVSGPATESIQTAREMLTLVKSDPRHLFNCGPLALRALMLALNADPSTLTFLQFYNAGPEGTTLSELGDLASRLKLDYRFVERAPGEPVPFPSIIHWKVGHFAAITGKENGRYHVRDAVFPSADIWVTPQALDAEASGYFMVPKTVGSNETWKMITLAEAGTVQGKGPTNGTRPGGAGDPEAGNEVPAPPKPGLPGNPPGSPPFGGDTGGGAGGQCRAPLCVVNIKESSVSIALSDQPVGYAPPIGPSMKVNISYNQRDDSQPANFDYFNIGQKWSMSWSSYVIDDPANPGANVSRVMGEGGAFYYTGYDAIRRTFAAQDTDGSILSVVSQSPVRYRRQLRDGGMEIYEQADATAAYPRKIFLSQVIDPQGNAATLHYDGQKRLTSITDAVGRDTTFSYDVPGRPLLVSKISDPFKRSATLAYDGMGRLISITDIIGLTSSFTYDANSLIDSLTTPYGTTRFSYTAPGTASPPRFAQITDPLGNKEREEWLEPAPIPASDPAATVPVGMPLPLTNAYLTYRNSFHWDKSAYVAARCTDTGGCDYTKARIRHFVHMPGTSIKGTAIESQKYPLENRVWYTYPGQSGSAGTLYGGTYNRPTAIGRVLDNGTSQISTFDYDSNGNITRATDPYGRATYYAYTNGIDIAAVSQAGEFGTRSTLAQYIYNKQHRPIYYADAAGRAATYAYNSLGQVTSLTNALGEQTTYQYDANSNPASTVNANGAIAASYTYDGFARVKTYTDSEGWTVTFDYDAADRPTRITYPDGTSARYTYQRLELVGYKDREGRSWQYQYDANRRLVAVIDPLRQTTKLGYDPAGNLTSLTDPKGNVTSWVYDVQDRQTSKQYADNSAVTYAYETTSSRLKSTLDALGQTKQYSYAIDDNLTGLTYLNAINPTPNVSFTYDPYFSRLASMTDGVGVTNYTYYPSFVDGAQQLAQECFTADGATGCSHTISYGYDALGRSAGRQISGSGPETFQYDAIGRVTNHSSDLGAFQLSYLGQTQQLTARQLLPVTSSLKTTWSYLDNAHDRRLSGIANTGLTAGQFTNFTFATTPENYISGVTQTSDAAVAEPEPDPEGQIISINNVNEITRISGQDYGYDANGNLLSDGKRNYAWDAENRIIEITETSEPTKHAQFTYDGIGRRVGIAKSPSGGGTTNILRYVWCGSIICQVRDAAYGAIRAYFDEGEDITGVPDGALYYGVDQIGSIRRVFQNEASKIDYDPWGVELGANAERADFGYAGMLSFDNMTAGLTWYRIYDPKIGRWLSRDPLGEKLNDPNTYGYVINNPLKLVDSLGLCVENSDNPPAAAQSPWDGSYEVAGKGERGYSGSPYGTNNPFKHMRPHPSDPSKVIYKDPQTGKKIIKPMPPGFPGGDDDDD